jgi:hypothetical protein
VLRVVVGASAALQAASIITGSHTSCAWQRSVPWRFVRPRQILDEMTSSDISTFE